MANESAKCVLNIRNFPAELRKRLKIRAAAREVGLQDLVIEYLQSALERDKKGREDKQNLGEVGKPL